MKLIFSGWKREMMEHSHSVIPVTLGRLYTPGEVDDPLTWHTALQAFGKVDGLGLGGSFLVEFNFEQEELRNWLRQFVLSKPEAAIKMLGEMQGEAILALARKTEERISERGMSDLSAPTAAVTRDGSM